MAQTLNAVARRYVYAISFAGIAVGAWALVTSEVRSADLAALAVFGLLTLAAPLLTKTYRGNLPTGIAYQLSTSFLYTLFVLVDPGVVVGLLWAYVVVDKFANARAWMKTLFNVGQMSLAMAPVVWVVRAIDLRLQSPADLTPVAIGLALALALLFALTNHMLTHVVVCLAARQPLWPMTWFVREGVRIEILLGIGGLLHVVCWVNAPWLAVLSVLPVWALFQMSLHSLEREGHLTRKSGELRGLQDLGLEIGAVLDRSRLARSVVRIAVTALEAQGALLLRHDATSGSYVPESSDGMPEGLAPIPTEAIDPRIEERATLVDDFRGFVRDHASLAALPGDGALLATLGQGEQRDLLLVVHDGRRRRFDDDDRERLETLARFISVALTNARLVDDLRAMQAQAVQAEKMSALGLFTSGVAHELNNPLTAVIGFAEVLGENEANPRRRRMLDWIDKEGKRAARIVSKLLTFARDQPPELVRVDLNRVVGDVLDFRSYSHGINNIDVEQRLAFDLPPVDADPHELQQVLLNLLINAEHAIATARRPRGRIAVRTYAAGDRVSLEVSDNGGGIPDELVDRIFDPFFSTKSVGQGTGLGLSICYSTIRNHRGDIRVTRTGADGTTLCIELPASLDTRPPAPGTSDFLPVARPEAVAPPEVGRLLVVDDEFAVRDLISGYFEPRGWTVRSAREGYEALELLDRYDFDVLLVDLRMPGMDGRAFFGKLRSLRPDLTDRVIFATGGAWPDSPPGPTLSKPFDLDDLRARLQRALRL